jgi:hypothetical protein
MKPKLQPRNRNGKRRVSEVGAEQEAMSEWEGWGRGRRGLVLMNRVGGKEARIKVHQQQRESQ